ncbi:hypothetical protein [Pseudomonas gessardii]|uniref:Filamentous hemagglutinin n=1 Tax=Pseudomonas gessardii TaxID=78544 RepID=A0ABS9F1C9_9PSED|nr:hypothetical protein [Pseudomonas gessardii]MBH3421409.1 hypothetical protein [Pseudomonas gessardii]MCF4976975.1 hypothetical protein [Pseudomonas gessardii]MCF4987950.1 hypothetical protein [Pseudomonas gessardii]MCF5082955.1 hypothetical protein [Pseudomonas gessardii]MCF5093406.1 hypothetical protein [Pseudomonas gessardii]
MTISNVNNLVTLPPVQDSSSTPAGEARGIRVSSNDRGGNTYSIYGPSDPRAGSHKIQGFQTGKDLIDFSDTLKHMGLNSFTLQTLGPDAIKKPGDTLLNWVPEDNTTYIHVHNRPPLSITAEGEVRNGDIVGSGWT